MYRLPCSSEEKRWEGDVCVDMYSYVYYITVGKYLDDELRDLDFAAQAACS